MMRIAAKVFVGLMVLLALVYLGDWAVWRVKVGMGGGMGRMTVSRVVVAPLKDNREEYYSDGKTEVDCSLSLFPQGGSEACWWVERHRVVFDR